MKTLDDQDQVDELNKLTAGKTISRMAYNEDGLDCLSIYFTDGTFLFLSTLGGIEILPPFGLAYTTSPEVKA